MGLSLRGDKAPLQPCDLTGESDLLHLRMRNGTEISCDSKASVNESRVMHLAHECVKVWYIRIANIGNWGIVRNKIRKLFGDSTSCDEVSTTSLPLLLESVVAPVH